VHWKLIVLGGAVYAALGLSSAASAAGGPHDFAVGSAKNRAAEFSQSPFQLEVSAHRLSDTEVTGHVRGSGDLTGDLPSGEFTVEGHVTCLRVEPKPAPEALVTGPGTRAAIKYVVDNSNGSFAPPQGWVIEVFVEDNGHPRNGQPVDGNATLLPVPPDVSDPRTCDDPNVAGQPYNPVDQGDYVVHAGDVAP
jgi:hypothetical protein